MQRLRWGVLLSALAATVAAIVYPGQEVEIPLRPAPSRQRAVAPETFTSAVPEGEIDWVASDENPFAPRGWVRPLPPAPAIAPVAAPASVDIAPPPPPTLPFKFIGQMVDGADRVVYLQLGEQVLLARTGEILEGSYKVTAITPTQIEFEFMQSGLRQTLSLPGQDH